jgi:hypothetical protein
MFMRKNSRNMRADKIASAIFIILFTYTAVTKIIDYPTFRIALVQSPVLEHYAAFAAVAVPVAELAIVALLIFTATRKAGLWASFALMIVFTLYIVYLMLFASSMPCNCGGILKALSWRSHLVVNILLVGLAGWALFDLRKNRTMIGITEVPA